MPRYRSFVLAALLVGCATGAPIATGPTGELPRAHRARPTSAAITPADLMSRLYPFADDSMMGREAGTRGNVMATDYVAREMARMGLRPAGENGTLVPDDTDLHREDGHDSHARRRGHIARLRQGLSSLPLAEWRTEPAHRHGDAVVRRRARDLWRTVGSGALVSPAAAEGKLVVFTVPVSATTGRRDWRFHTFGPLTQYAGAAGIAAIALDVVPRITAGRLHGPQVFVGVENVPPTPTPLVAADHSRRGARAVRRRVARRAHRRAGRSHRQGQRRVRRRACALPVAERDRRPPGQRSRAARPVRRRRRAQRPHRHHRARPRSRLRAGVQSGRAPPGRTGHACARPLPPRAARIAALRDSLTRRARRRAPRLGEQRRRR